MSQNPIICKSICKTAIWGGNNLSKIFDVDSPYSKVSEIWTASAHKNGETPIIISGKTENLSLSEYYKADSSKEVFGLKCRKYKEFPLLIKWIDANDKLSVQVHPDNEYAKKNHDSFGKTEAWFIVDAKPDAQIVYGLKPGTTREDFETALSENRVEEFLNFVPVKAGDVFFIPAGMVHALLDGIIVYEIQQSSDITYRLYDWNRVDDEGNSRELHIEKALDVIDFDRSIDTNAFNAGLESEWTIKSILNSKYFNLRICNIKGKNAVATSKESFKICSVLKGNITIKGDSYSYQVNAGETFILPAAKIGYLSPYTLEGTATIIEACVK